MLKRGKAGQGDVRVLLLAYGWILRALGAAGRQRKPLLLLSR